MSSSESIMPGGIHHEDAAARARRLGIVQATSAVSSDAHHAPVSTTVLTVLAVNPPSSWNAPSSPLAGLGNLSFQVVCVSVQDHYGLTRAMRTYQPRLVLLDAGSTPYLRGDTAAPGGHTPTQNPAFPEPCDWLLAFNEPATRNWAQVAIDWRATGSVDWHSDHETMVQAFNGVLTGEFWMPRLMTRWVYEGLLQALNQPAPAEPEATDAAAEAAATARRGAGSLTPREAAVDEAVRQGLTNKQIAQLLDISVSTVKKHVARVFEKRGLRHRRQRIMPDE